MYFKPQTQVTVYDLFITSTYIIAGEILLLIKLSLMGNMMANRDILRYTVHPTSGYTHIIS
jgi:hypothetical protein